MTPDAAPATPALASPPEAPAPSRPGRLPLAAAGGVAALGLAVVAYLYGLNHAFIPSIGDEPLYLQIARNTLASGRLLPLVSDTGITNTKPPLLFWQGIAAARLAGLELAALRLPSVLLTFATAALAGALAARLAGRRRVGVLAALVFLAFRSSMQYGRPFLTNPGEALFLFLPLVLLSRRERTGPGLAVACGASMGVAALYKSFAVVLPGTLALALVLLHRSGGRPGVLLRRHGRFLAGAAAVGLAVFGLWFVADPRPDLVLSQFVLGENGAKFRAAGLLAGLVSGPYPLWRIWLGPVLNAGLLAPVVVGLLVDLWRRRRAIPAEEAELWLYVLAFLLFYSVPTQRQENYLLPASGALAVLLALRWEAIGSGWFRAPLAALAAAAAALPLLESSVERAAGARLWTPATLAIPVALAGLAFAAALHARLARALLPALSLGALVAITSFLAPFSRPFSPAVARELRGRTALFPDRFQREHELYRFLVPGADVQGYPCPSGPVPCALPADAGGTYLAALEPSASAPPGYAVLEDRPHLRSRHSAAEIRAIAEGDLGLLLERLVLLRPTPAGLALRGGGT